MAGREARRRPVGHVDAYARAAVLDTLEVLAVELTNGRMTREAYIDAAVALGLTLGQAEIRAAAFSEMASCT